MVFPLFSEQREHSIVSSSPSKNSRPKRLGLHPAASFNFDCLHKGLISKHQHLGKGFNTWNLRSQNQSRIDTKIYDFQIKKTTTTTNNLEDQEEEIIDEKKRKNYKELETLRDNVSVGKQIQET